jgi:hypothetical protein
LLHSNWAEESCKPLPQHFTVTLYLLHVISTNNISSTKTDLKKPKCAAPVSPTPIINLVTINNNNNNRNNLTSDIINKNKTSLKDTNTNKRN